MLSKFIKETTKMENSKRQEIRVREIMINNFQKMRSSGRHKEETIKEFGASSTQNSMESTFTITQGNQ